MRNSRKVSIVRNNLTQTETESQEIFQHLGSVIKYFIKTTEISQAEFARRMGVKRPTVTGWIKGEYGFNLEHLYKMIDVFGITWREFGSAVDLLRNKKKPT